MNLAEILMLKFPNSNFETDIKLSDEGKGPFIREWNVQGVSKPTAADIETFRTEVQDAYDAQQTQYARQAGYRAAGATIDNMIVALWEKIVEGRAGSADALQTKRMLVKANNPK